MAETNETPAEQNVKPEQTTGAEHPEIQRDARMWAMICHLAGLAGFVIPVIISGIIAPLVIWQIKKEDDPFIDENGKEAVNFQISIGIYELVSIPLCFACIGFFTLPAVAIFNIVFLIIASIKANNGESYRYPLCIRFIK
ncbi:MAG: DUF4870 domain-containing protein [Sedimentisphaerales bacterium]|nr:DUF4870 domain-containing protein [Sedimentisphaerales bacterium]